MRKRVGFTVFILFAVAVMVGVPYVWGSEMLDDHRSSAAAPAVVSAPSSPQVEATRKAAPAAPAAPSLPPALLHPAPVAVNATGFWSWTVLDRRTGAMAGSDNAATTQRTASMIKAWLAADYLRRTPNPSTSNLRQLTSMIRNSDNTAASYFWGLNGKLGQHHASCPDVRSHRQQGVHRLGQHHGLGPRRRPDGCVHRRRTRGRRQVDRMAPQRDAQRQRQSGVRVVPALPATEQPATAVKNGWIARSDGKWHVNCMAVGTDWVLSVLTVYPSSKGMNYGAEICSSVTRQLQA